MLICDRCDLTLSIIFSTQDFKILGLLVRLCRFALHAVERCLYKYDAYYMCPYNIETLCSVNSPLRSKICRHIPVTLISPRSFLRSGLFACHRSSTVTPAAMKEQFGRAARKRMKGRERGREGKRDKGEMPTLFYR